MSPAYSVSSPQEHKEGRAHQVQPRERVLGSNDKGRIASSLFGPDSDESETKENPDRDSTHTG
eukprot:11678127-Ditylum_brightwellii.AAC.1